MKECGAEKVEAGRRRMEEVRRVTQDLEANPMPEFFYIAVTADGKVIEGSLLRDSERAVARELTTGGLSPVYVGAQRQKGGGSLLSFDSAALLRRRPGAADRLYFT